MSANEAWALRCGNALVHDNDKLEDVRKICGEPTKSFAQTLTYRAEKGSMSRERYGEQQVWIYIFGPNEFAQILQFENNKLKRITQGRYGRDYDINRENCKGPVFAVKTGSWNAEIELLCGEPDSKKRLERSMNPYGADSNASYSRESLIDAWRYDFPDSKKTAILKFDNGRLQWSGWYDTDDINW